MPSTSPALKAYIANKIEDLASRDNIAPHHAWPRVAAELLGYEDEAVEFLDQRDGGIDFFVSDSPVYQIFQAKMHEITGVGDIDTERPFDESGIQDLDRACTMLLDGQAPPQVDARLRALRQRIRTELSMVSGTNDEQTDRRVSVVFNLVLLGNNLAPRARTALDNFQRRLTTLRERTPGLESRFELLDLVHLAQFFEDPSRPAPRTLPPIRIRIALESLGLREPAQAAIHTQDFVTFYAPADDLVAAANASGPALFDANVRYELKKSRINEEIIRSATHAKTMRLFHLYNNGVTIAAEGWQFQNNRAVLEIRNAAVINGCQTLRSLSAAKQTLENQASDSPELLRAFADRCVVMVRLVRRAAVNADEIVRAANTQNAMADRNLLSNRPEQQQIERELQELGWFYERKDGAADALKEARRSSLNTPLADFQAPPVRRGAHRSTRVADNTLAAAAWLSFAGFSEEGQNQRSKHFNHTASGLYARIFLSHPSQHWLIATLEGATDPNTILREGRVPASSMLLAHHVLLLVKHVLPSAGKMRAQIRRDLLSRNLGATIAQINERIMAREDYRVPYALSMLDHVIVGLVGFSFARCLGDDWLTVGPARTALRIGVLGHFHTYAQMPDDLSENTILQIPPTKLAQDPSLLAIRLACRAIQGTLAKPEYESSFKSAERKSRYLQQDNLVQEFARMLDQYNQYFAHPGNVEAWWPSGGALYPALRRLLTE